MRIILSMAALGVAFAAFQIFTPSGSFSRLHKISFINGYDEAGCKAEQGEWSADGACLLDAEDVVTVVRKGQEYAVKVSTVTTNARMCDFEGKGRFNSRRELIASARTEEYVGGRFLPVTCSLKVTYSGNDLVNVSRLSAHSKCAALCGAGAGLEIKGATRRQ